MDWVGRGYEMTKKILGTKMHVGDEKPENARVVMFHSSLEKDGTKLKDMIFQNLAKDPADSPLKIVLATVALGMGADLRHVQQVINAGPPKNMEEYIQQIGRAGRSGTPATAVMYYNNNEVGRPDMSKAMKAYCKNKDQCRRKMIDLYFGFDISDSQLPVCCDVCQPDLTVNWMLSKPLDTLAKYNLRHALLIYVRAGSLESIVTNACVEQLINNVHHYENSQAVQEDFGFTDIVSDTLSNIISQMLSLKE